MPIAFLEKYKVMLSILAVIAIGGILLASNIRTDASSDGDAEQLSNEETAEEDSEQLAKADNAGWASATSFDDMLGDEAEEDSLDDNGFARTNPNEIDGVLDSSDGDGDFAENTQNNGPSPFAGAPAPSSGSAKSSSPATRIVVAAEGGEHAPIAVDASRISPSVGGKGKGDAGEVE